MTKEELVKAMESIWMGKRQIETMEMQKKLLHERYDPLTKLADNAQFWPNGFTEHTFLELDAELVLIDATVALARERLGQADKLVHDLAQYLKIDDLYRRMKQTPPLGRGGVTLTMEFDQALHQLEVALDDIPMLQAELEYHITGVTTLVG
jgi:hypothetical protein